MRVEIRQASACKGFAEDFANGCGVPPMASFKTRDLKLASRPQGNLRCREQRIVVAPEFFFLQIGHPRVDNCADFFAHRKEKGFERFAEFCSNLPRILVDAPRHQVNVQKYLGACPQPWKDCAVLILDEGFRPSEVFALQWPHVSFEKIAIQDADGKSRAARRVLPMAPRVQTVLLRCWEAAGKPTEGFIFPSGGKCGHFDQNVAKDQHKRALEDCGVRAFVPYTLRHTSRTRLGEKAGGDIFVLARIAGHSTISVTQRYIHPQADAINRVFAASLPRVGTKLGTARKSGARGGLKEGKKMALKSS
jgi:integrase